MKKSLLALALGFGMSMSAMAQDIVDVAVKAGNFKTLVAAVQAAGLVDTLKGTGPFTVFAPTDEAFAKIPKATLDGLLKDKAALSKIEAFKASGPNEKQVNDVKAAMLKDFETNIKQNTYVLSQLAFKYQNGEAPDTLITIPSFYDKLSMASIKAAANTYLNTKRYVKVVLLPEK